MIYCYIRTLREADDGKFPEISLMRALLYVTQVFHHLLITFYQSLVKLNVTKLLIKYKLPNIHVNVYKMTFHVLPMKICNDIFEWNKTLNALFIVIQLYWFCPSRYVWHMLWFHYSGVYKKKLDTYCSLMCTMFSISANINRIIRLFSLICLLLYA